MKVYTIILEKGMKNTLSISQVQYYIVYGGARISDTIWATGGMLVTMEGTHGFHDGEF